MSRATGAEPPSAPGGSLRRVRAGLAAVVVAGAVLAPGGCSCGSGEPIDGGASSSTAGAGGAGGEDVLVTATTGGPPPPDADLCGNQVHDVAFDAPALYFVLDASGSMAEQLEDGRTRYRAMHDAVVDLVARLGDRARVGAAVFPAADPEGSPCRPGEEVMPVTLGDPADATPPGPTTTSFGEATDVEPGGGTPTAATLVAVRDALADVDGRRAVVLVTDGGPNCNEALSCDATSCIPNIEGMCPSEYENCCDPELGGTTGNCLDRAATLEAVAALRDDGALVHVIGVAGSAPFAATLSQMAILGGAPTAAAPFYYEADDVEALTGALGAIAVVNGSCDFELDEPPPVTWRTNVWLDADLIPYDPVDGWMWRGAPLDYVPRPPAGATSSGAGGAGGGGADGGGGLGGTGPGGGGAAGAGEGGGPEVDTSAVELRGESCRRFRAGEVRRVQIVTGCPITTPN